jgi:hypothetical protein
VGRKPAANPRPEDHEPWTRLSYSGELARHSKTQRLPKGRAVNTAGAGRRSALLPGEIWRVRGTGLEVRPVRNPDREVRLNRQKSAAAIVPASRREGPNAESRLATYSSWGCVNNGSLPLMGTCLRERAVKPQRPVGGPSIPRREANRHPAGCSGLPSLSSANRPVRTRMPGGVGGEGRRPAPPIPIAPGMGVSLVGCKSPAVKVAKPLAKGKGACGDAGSEGSRRQSPDLRNTNRVRGYRTWVSLQHKVKPVATEGCGGKRGGDGMKDGALTRGGLAGTSAKADKRGREVSLDPPGVSRGHSTRQGCQAGEGPNVRRGMPLVKLERRT